MSKPVNKRLGDIANFKRGYDLPSYNRKAGEYPIISSSGISGYHSEYKKDGEGIITGRYGTLGTVYYVNGKYWPHNTALYVTDFKENYPKYVYYLMKCLGSLKTSDKSTVPGINRNDLHEILVPHIKNLQTQRQIASVLSSLDAKIELNNKINAGLEAMAITIYDYWFVQFDFPYSPPSEGLGVVKPYKSSGGKMVYNQELKREIPEGWEVKELQEIAKCLMGQSPKGESYNQDGIGTPLLNGPADYENGALKGRTYTTEPTRFCQKDDLVLCIRATIGNLVYSEQEFCLGRGVAAVRANDKRLSELIYFLLIQEIERFKVQATGSIIVGITKDDLIESKCLIPKAELLDSFHNLIKPQFDKIRINIKENQKLTELRDWLLPMLMNGQVTVKDAYAMLDEQLSMAAE